MSHLRSNMAMFQADNRQIYKQLCQNKDGIQDYQTHHQHLEAKSVEGALLYRASYSNCELHRSYTSKCVSRC